MTTKQCKTSKTNPKKMPQLSGPALELVSQARQQYAQPYWDQLNDLLDQLNLTWEEREAWDTLIVNLVCNASESCFLAGFKTARNPELLLLYYTQAPSVPSVGHRQSTERA